MWPSLRNPQVGWLSLGSFPHVHSGLIAKIGALPCADPYAPHEDGFVILGFPIAGVGGGGGGGKSQSAEGSFQSRSELGVS